MSTKYSRKRWGYRRPPGNYHPDFTRYEQLKGQWKADNPKATPEQYQTAMREIANQCKI